MRQKFGDGHMDRRIRPESIEAIFMLSFWNDTLILSKMLKAKFRTKTSRQNFVAGYGAFSMKFLWKSFKRPSG